MHDQIRFHLWLKQRRISLDLSRTDLAAQVGCSMATISQIEQGTRRPSQQLAARLAHYLQIAPEERAWFLRALRTPLPQEPPTAPDHPDLVSQLAHPVPGRRIVLPEQTNQLIGREHDLAVAQALARRPEVRLLTLIGPGGVGKTRLSLELATELSDQFADGTYFVALAPLKDPALIARMVAQTLQLMDAKTTPTPERLVEALREREVLLLFDNFEHVLPGALLIAQLLAGCPRLKIITTSRSALHVRYEYLFTVPPLMLPNLTRLPAESAALVSAVQDAAAVQLFVSCAQTVQPTFALSEQNASIVGHICQALDGLPLAIELAAARVRGLPPTTMLARLNHRLALLTGGDVDRPDRQQTMRAAIDWSYQLLDAQEQRLLRQLAVFVGGCMLEAAEAVCLQAEQDSRSIMDGVLSLLDKSLLYDQQHGEETSFVMLETIREYALERLEESGESEQLRARHAAYYLALVELAEPQLTRPQQQQWLDRLEWEHDNLRAVLRWLIDRGEAELVLRCMSAIWKFWQFRDHQSEGLRWVLQALALPYTAQSRAADLTRAKLLCGAGWLAVDQDNDTLGRSMFDESLRLARELDDPPGIGLALHGVGAVRQGQGDLVGATACYQESLEIFQALDNSEEIAWSLRHLGTMLQLQGRDTEALPLYEEGLARIRALGHQWGLVRQLMTLAHLCMELGDYQRATTLLEEGLELCRSQGYPYLVIEIMRYLGRAAFDQGRYDQSKALFEQTLALAHELHESVGIRWSLAHLGRTALALGQIEQAQACLTEASALAEKSGDRWALAWLSTQLGHTALAADRRQLARTHYRQSLIFYHRSDLISGFPECFEGLAATLAAELGAGAQRATYLLSAADRLRETLSKIRSISEQGRYDWAIATAQAGLSSAAFALAWQAGQELPLEQVVAAALDDLSSDS